MPWRKESQEVSREGIAGLIGNYRRDIAKGDLRSFQLSFGDSTIRLRAQRFSSIDGGLYVRLGKNHLTIADLDLVLGDEEASAYLGRIISHDKDQKVMMARQVPGTDISYGIEHSLIERQCSGRSVSSDSALKVQEILTQISPEEGERIGKELRQAKEISISNALKGHTPTKPAFELGLMQRYTEAHQKREEEDAKPPSERDYSEVLKTYLMIIRSLPFKDASRVMHKLEVLLPRAGKEFTADGYVLNRVSNTKVQQSVYEEARLVSEDAVQNVGFAPGKFSPEESCLKYVCTPEAIADRADLVDMILACLESDGDAVEIKEVSADDGYILTLRRADGKIGIDGKVLNNNPWSDQPFFGILSPLGTRDARIDVERYYKSEFSKNAAEAWDKFKDGTKKLGRNAYDYGAKAAGIIATPPVLLLAGIGAVLGFAYKYLVQKPAKAAENTVNQQIVFPFAEMRRRFEEERRLKEKIIADSLASRLPQNKGSKGCVIIVDPNCEAKLVAGELLPKETGKPEGCTG